MANWTQNHDLVYAFVCVSFLADGEVDESEKEAMRGNCKVMAHDMSEDDYNTVEGIMSGYNANQMTDKTFDKRTDRIAKTLKDKYGVDISSLSEEDIENFDPTNPAFNLVNRVSLINQAKTIWQNNKKRNKKTLVFFMIIKSRPHPMPVS